MKKFNSYQIKLFMMFLMVVDHLSIIPNFLPFELIAIFHLITRPVALWFTFTLVEGFIHTHNRYEYCRRLFTFAAIMMAGSSILLFGFGVPILPIYPNIIFSLALTCAILILIYHHDEKIDKIPNIVRKILAIFIFLVCFFFAEGMFIVPLFAIIFYKYRDNPKGRNIWLIGMSLVMLALTLSYVTSMPNPNIYTIMYSEWFFASVIPFIYLYNGERGPNTKFSKYIFYIFYPVHIWILYIIATIIVTRSL
ncbi:TraX family protein [Anaerorhabdus sp.]